MIRGDEFKIPFFLVVTQRTTITIEVVFGEPEPFVGVTFLNLEEICSPTCQPSQKLDIHLVKFHTNLASSNVTMLCYWNVKDSIISFKRRLYFLTNTTFPS